jgi:hypothetical protein
VRNHWCSHFGSIRVGELVLLRGSQPVGAVFVYEGSVDRSTQAVVECLHSDAKRAGRSFPRAASLCSQARDEALRIRLCSVATSGGVFGR